MRRVWPGKRIEGLLHGAIAVLLVSSCAACRPAAAANPPVPEGIEAIDPELRLRVNEFVEDVREQPRDAGRWMRLGMLYEAHAFDTPAAVCYREALRLDRDDARWWYRLAVVEGRLGDIPAALSSIQEAIARDEQYAPLHWRRGFWLLDSGDPTAALKAFRLVTSRWPAEPAGWIGLARVHLNLRQPAEAVDALRAVLAIERPITMAAIRHTRHLLAVAQRQGGAAASAGEASAAYREAEPAWTDAWSDELATLRTGYAALFKEAVERDRAGESQRAIALFERLRQQKPHDVTLLNHLAVARIRAGQVPDAIGVLRSALEVEPTRAETNLNLAAAYLEMGDTVLAHEFAERALRLNPALSKAHEVKGVVAWRTQRLADALVAFEAAARYDPRNTVALVSAGMVLGALRRPGEALARFEAALVQDPANVDAYIGVAMAHMAGGRFSEAEAAAQNAAALDPHNPRVKALKAQLVDGRTVTGAER